MNALEIITLSIAAGSILFFVAIMIKTDTDKGKPYVRDILREIKDNENIFSLVKKILAQGGMTEEEIIKTTGDKLTPLRLLSLGVSNYHVGLTLAPLPPSLPPVTYRNDGKIEISPEWLGIIQRAQSADWDIKKIRLPRC